MILEQQIWKAKAGRKDDLAALGKALGQRIGVPYRVYTPLTHPSTIVVFEFQFDDLAQHSTFWAKWSAQPDAQEFQRQLREMVEKEHRDELHKVL